MGIKQAQKASNLHEKAFETNGDDLKNYATNYFPSPLKP